MRQAIVTTYHGPTPKRGSRIIARAAQWFHTVPWDYELSVDRNHAVAAQAFALKLGWSGEWYGGADTKHHYFVMADGKHHRPYVPDDYAFVIHPDGE